MRITLNTTKDLFWMEKLFEFFILIVLNTTKAYT